MVPVSYTHLGYDVVTAMNEPIARSLIRKIPVSYTHLFFATQGRWPNREDGALATWCYTQRERRKKGRLSKERIRVLDEIGFEIGRAHV